MPIGKYIYCTHIPRLEIPSLNVTNAYRQVHLLYIRSEKQIIIVCSQMPIGKYIYCTTPEYGVPSQCIRHKCLSASTFTVPSSSWHQCGRLPAVTNAYRQVHLLYQMWEGGFPQADTSQMPIGKYIYCTALKPLSNFQQNCHKCLSASTFTVPS